MSFKDWLKLDEVGTGTSSVAAFARPIFGQMVQRTWPDPFFSKKKKKKKKMVADDNSVQPSNFGNQPSELP